MTVLPQTVVPEGPLRHEAAIPSHYLEDAQDTLTPLRFALFRCTALAATLAAVGLWLVPVDQGDPLMQLFKLFLSASLLFGAGTLLSSLRAPEGPTVEIDPRRRTLTIIEHDARGRVRMQAEHAIDTLSEIVLRDRLLSARDAQGRSLITLPVSDAATHAALARVLGQGAGLR